MSELDLLFVSGGTICIKQATKRGFIELGSGERAIVDLSYPRSKTRRGRVQGGGSICPTLTAESNGLFVIEREP